MPTAIADPDAFAAIEVASGYVIPSRCSISTALSSVSARTPRSRSPGGHIYGLERDGAPVEACSSRRPPGNAGKPGVNVMSSTGFGWISYTIQL